MNENVKSKSTLRF